MAGFRAAGRYWRGDCGDDRRMVRIRMGPGGGSRTPDVCRVLHPFAPDAASATPFKSRGVYLILGGGGGIGLELARYLADNAQAKLALLGRSAPTPELEKELKKIERLGGEALYLQADATDLSSLRDAVQKAKIAFGALNGVVHSAVVLRDKALDNMDEAMLRTALASKVAGSINLYRAVAGEPLDFLLFFSSVQSFLGNAGQANYAGASTFQDAFAQSIARLASFPVKTINWGYWGEIGVAASEQFRARLASQGVGAIAPGEGMEALRRALTLAEPQVIVVKAADHVLSAMGVVSAAARLKKSEAGKLLEKISPEQLAALSDQEASQSILRGLSFILGEVLQVDAARDFADLGSFAELQLSSLGIDSLMATELRNRVRTWVNVDVPAHMLIGGSAISEVAELIHQKSLLAYLSRVQPEKNQEAPADEEVFVL